MALKKAKKSLKSKKEEKALSKKKMKAEKPDADEDDEVETPKAKKGFPKGGFPKGKGKKTKRAPLPTWKAPEDFKPFFLEVNFKTEKDGLPGQTIQAIRYQGRYDPKADDSKKFDLSTYDIPTLLGIQARLSMTQFHATGRPTSKGVPTRLERDGVYRVVLRVGKKKADNSLTARIKDVYIAKKKASGKVKAVLLDKKDPAVRKIKKANRYLAAAFKNVLVPPKRTKSRRKDADEE